MKYGLLTIGLLFSFSSFAEQACMNVREIKKQSIETTEICLKTRDGFESANGIKIWEPDCEEGTSSCDKKQELFDQAHSSDACFRHSLQQINIQYKSQLADLEQKVEYLYMERADQPDAVFPTLADQLGEDVTQEHAIIERTKLTLHFDYQIKDSELNRTGISLSFIAPIGVSGKLPDLLVSQTDSCSIQQLITSADSKADTHLDENLMVSDTEESEPNPKEKDAQAAL
ncbi:MAG: hypothetical protein HRT45_10660 [Bdellovibrionales bacterium]|nr:hypothetical protein [Bdellovibrionales bacterium]